MILKHQKTKSKNKKEFQKKNLDLCNMKPESREIVLRYYYDYFVAFTNIKAAIHWCAIHGVKKLKKFTDSVPPQKS